MAFRIHNSLTGKKEDFQPQDPDRVRIYNCGPTVYGFNHIGNFRSYMFVDILRRYLLFRGYRVEQAMNITDVDDKIIDNALKAGLSIEQFTAPFTAAFLEDLRLLNILDVEHRPRATESIPAMIDLVRRLEQNGHVYQMDGNLYFRIESYPEYGTLSGLEAENLRTAADGRFEADEYSKEDVRDFALWKKPVRENEPAWDSPWGRGRPGWHLECSAMIRDIFKERGVDIHIGGVDLLFPHHENEIAQSRCAYPGENFSRYWMHNEHLLVDGRKMSKSLGNFYTLRELTREEEARELVAGERAPGSLLELIERGKIFRDLRYLLLSFHYRTKLNFTFDNLHAADQACDRLNVFVRRMRNICGDERATDIREEAERTPAGEPGQGGADLTELLPPIAGTAASFLEAMDDDLNTARALASLFDFIRECNQRADRSELSPDEAADTLKFLRRVDTIFDVIDFEADESADFRQPVLAGDLRKTVEDSIALRNEARARKDFAEADRIRDELLSQGIRLIDTPDGTRWESG